jgi:hypothetical protein
MMDIEDSIWDILESSRIVSQSEDSESLLNTFQDKLRAHNLSLDFLQDCVEYLLGSIFQQIDPRVRGDQFEMLEAVYRKNPSVEIDLSQLITLFDDSDRGLIANTLLLFPIAKKTDDFLPLAQKYAAYEDAFVRKNAEYALTYLSKGT